MPRPAQTFSRFVVLPENRAAWQAVHNLRANVGPRLLYLHGPPGTGKTHLVHAVTAEVRRQIPDSVIVVYAAGELVRAEQLTLFNDQDELQHHPQTAELEAARHCDLLIIEDLQHLHLSAVEALVQVLDCLLASDKAVIVTANAGPRQLLHRDERFPARLTSRLAAGLVLAMEPLGTASRLALLQAQAQKRQLAIPTEALRWLADHLSSGRELEGAIAQLEALAKVQHGPLTLAMVVEAFQDQVAQRRMTVDRIVQGVCELFQTDSEELQSHRRSRNVLLPRQVGMYLARRLTDLSLQQIGALFGGRDHSTVLHAVRKVEAALEHDPRLSGAVRQLQAELA